MVITYSSASIRWDPICRRYYAHVTSPHTVGPNPATDDIGIVRLQVVEIDYYSPTAMHE